MILLADAFALMDRNLFC